MAPGDRVLPRFESGKYVAGAFPEQRGRGPRIDSVGGGAHLCTRCSAGRARMIILLKTLPTDLDITRVRSRPERSRRRCTTLAPRHGTRIRADEPDHLNPSPLTPGGEPIPAWDNPRTSLRRHRSRGPVWAVTRSPCLNPGNRPQNPRIRERRPRRSNPKLCRHFLLRPPILPIIRVGEVPGSSGAPR